MQALSVELPANIITFAMYLHGSLHPQLGFKIIATVLVACFARVVAVTGGVNSPVFLVTTSVMQVCVCVCRLFFLSLSLPRSAS